jgi:dipeptide transport system ATP-binding protein
MNAHGRPDASLPTRANAPSGPVPTLSSAGAEAVMEATALRKSYDVRRGLFAPPASVQALDGISFRLAAGRTLAVVGESGCGKSTLARLLTMIESPDSGTLRVGGLDIARASRAERRQLRRDVQIVFQNPYGSLNPRQTVGAALAEPLEVNTSLGASEREHAVRETMVRVGLRPEYIRRYPHMFSGGQRQRIAIARALMLRPKILVLDEPVSALDVSIRAQVLNLLVELQETFGLAYVFISHDLSVVRHIADEVLVMYLGRAAEHGSREAIFTHAQHPYTRALLSATPLADPAARATRAARRILLRGELPSPFSPPVGCAFHPRCPIAMPSCRDERPALRSEGGNEEDRFACIAPRERREDAAAFGIQAASAESATSAGSAASAGSGASSTA